MTEGPRRIFISYGRQDSADAARVLASTLRAQGYDPWLDTENGVPSGAPFDIRIEVGIAESDLLVALLSPWSLRPEGFCRNELLYAQASRKPILPIRVADVTPPIQIISLNYIDAPTALRDPEAAFADVATEIERILAGGAGRDAGAGPDSWAQSPWWTSGPAFDFEQELARRGASFVGREWLIDLLRERVQDPAVRLVLLVGAAGFGKSALAAQLTARLNVRGVHFCNRSSADSCRPEVWLRQLVHQLAVQFTPYRERLEQLSPPDWEDPPEALFQRLVATPLARCRDELDVTEPWVFVLDGLDEAVAETGPAMADFLVRSVDPLPDFLRLVVTTRPDRDLEAQFRRPSVSVEALRADGAPNLTDVSDYVAHRLDGRGEDLAAAGRHVVELAAGNFLFARVAVDGLLEERGDHRISADELAALPPGLGGLYHEMFAKRFKDPDAFERDVAPLLDCLVAALDAIPESLLVMASGLDARTARRGLRDLDQFLDETDSGVRLFHQSLAEWLADDGASGRFTALAAEGAARLTDACWTEYARGSGTVSDYCRKHLIAHLSDAGKWGDLAQVLADVAFVSQVWSHDEYQIMRAWADVEAHTASTRAQAYATLAADPSLAGASSAVLMQIGHLLYLSGDLDMALALHKAAEVQCRADGCTDDLQRSLGVQAFVLHDRGDAEGALALYRERERICRESGLLDGLQAALGNQALILFDRGDAEGALALHREEEDVCRKLGLLEGLQASLGNQAMIHNLLGNDDTAWKLLVEKERICREFGFQDGLQVAIGNEALVLEAGGDLQAALVLLQENERVCREYGIVKSLHRSLGDQANIHRRLGDLDKALALDREKERICRDLGLPDGLQRSLGNQALTLLERDDTEAAVRLLEEQEEICRRCDLPDGLQRSLGNRAIVLHARGDLQEALAMLREQASVCRALGNTQSLRIALADQAVVLRDLGDRQAAAAMLDESSRVRGVPAAAPATLDELRMERPLTVQGRADDAQAFRDEAAKL